MQRRTSKLSRIALAIAVSLASRSTGANPASESRVELLSPSAPLIRTGVQYGGALDAWARLPSIDLVSPNALDLTLVVPRVVEPTPISTAPLVQAPRPVAAPYQLELILELMRDAPPPTPGGLPGALPAIHAVPRTSLDPPGLSDPEIMSRFITRAPKPRVTVELSADGTGILFYIDHGVGIPIQLAGKPTDEHAARNFAAVAHDRRLSFPRSLRIDAEYGVEAELVDGSHVHYTDDAIGALVPPVHVLRMKPSSRRVAAR
ncbi:MAG TPA: hypothetical protein VGD80_12515 [Kofleriaceae bacterium]